MNLCSPALLYLVFSVTQVVIDSIKGLYNVALLKFVMMILFTLLLNILCERGLGIVSWIIVFIPFLLMSLITTILLFVFGLDPSSGNIIPPSSTVPSSQTTTSTTTQHKKKGTQVAHSPAKHEDDKSKHHHDLDREIDNKIKEVKKSFYSQLNKI